MNATQWMHPGVLVALLPYALALACTRSSEPGPAGRPIPLGLLRQGT